MIMREYCYKILTLVMVATMSIPSYAQNTVTEHGLDGWTGTNGL